MSGTKEDRSPFTTTLKNSVKKALKRESFERDQPMGEIIEEGLAAIGITGDKDKEKSSEKDSSRE